MAKKPAKQSTELTAVHKRAMERAQEAFVFERDNIREGREDQRFYAGDQWDEAARKARGTDRPMLTINRMGTFVRQVTGDLRTNTPGIKVLPSKGPASQEKADIFAGVIRSIEAESDATACYVRAAANAAQAGQGAFRVLTKYCDEDSFDQDIVIEQIADPFAVLIDPLARKPDKSDMGYAYVFERYSKEAFKAKWPKASLEDMPVQKDENGAYFQWVVGESVRVAEYWEREVTKATLYQLADGTITDTLPPGAKAEREREVEQVSIVSYMISGKEVLSGPHPWAGKVGIPICFVPGEEITIDGATKRKGMIRDAKDPQRLLNYARTTDAETTALQPKAPFVLTKDQIKGYEVAWKQAGTSNQPYLLYNYNPAMGPNQAPQRSQPPAMSSALQNLSATAGNDLHEVIGIYPASLGARSNETSGVAIRARQHEGDTGSNYIPDNTRRAIAYCGRILCDLIPKIYDSERIVRILKEDGSHDMQPVNVEMMDESGAAVIANALDDGGKYDVTVGTGPSYLTRQQEMADTIVELSRNMPQVGQVAPDLLVKALNFPGGDEIAKRLERTLPKAITSDEPQPPPPPSPDDIKALADAEKAKAQAEGETIANLKELVGLAQILQGIPQQIAAMQQQLARYSGAGQQPPEQGGPPPGAPPEGMPPPPDQGQGPQLEPMDQMGGPELEPMPDQPTA